MDRDFFSSIVDSSKEAILTAANSGKIHYCNRAGRSLLQLSEKDISDQNFYQLLADKDIAEVTRIIELLPENSSDAISLTASFKKTTSQSPIRFEVRKIIENGDVRNVFVMTSINERDENVYQLHKLFSESKYDINILLDDEQVIYVSPSIKDFLGYAAGEIKNTTDWFQLFDTGDLASFQKKLQIDRNKKKTSSQYIYRQQHKDGTFRWFETKIQRILKENGGIVEMANSVDISERKNIEIQLELQKEFIEQLYDADPNLVFVRDSKGRIIYCNKAVCELVGLPREEFLAQDYNMFPASKGQEEKYLEMECKVIDHGEEILIEEQIFDSKGVVNHFQTIKKPLKTKGGDINMLSISTNINRIKYYEKESQNVMKAKNEFFSAMSHEIRTPMNAILGMTELLLRRKPRKDQSKLLETLHFSSKNLLSLINDILDFSKIEAGKIEIEEVNFNVKELIENILVSLRPKALEKNLALSYELDKNLPDVINGDYIKLSQILNNLLSNAIKFTNKGKVRIKIQEQTILEDGYNIKFEVKDTGIGIPEEKMNNIFDPFRQASKSTTRVYGGTGLGLSIVQNLVVAQKGKISVKSTENKGSTFTVLLPYKEADTSLPINSLAKSGISDFKWKMNLNIMYVEDVTTNQFLIEEILSDWGVTVDMASDGYEAIKMIESKDYDLILMDIQMPGIDGLETTRRIRAMEDSYFKNIPILALTASTTDATKDEIFMSGMQDYILKPISVEDLRAKIVEFSSLVDEFKDLKIVDVESEIENEDTKIIFEKTDKLFLENFVRYQEFLSLTVNEFKVNLDLLKLAIYDVDLVKYRHLRHRMKSLISTFGMKELLKLMDEIKDRLKEGALTDKEKKEYINALDYHINFLLDSLSNKLASLKWQ